MEDIFQWCKEGNALQVRVWMDEPEHDLNQGDDHGFSPLHWAAMKGHNKIVEMLLLRGARVNATNRGDDTPLHLAAAHGHREIVGMLLRQRADVNFTNEHGNAPLHYACFWNHPDVAEDLIHHGAKVAIANKYGATAVDKCPPASALAPRLRALAAQLGQDLDDVIAFKDQSYLGFKTRSRDATLSRHKGIVLEDLQTKRKLAEDHTGVSYLGRWQNNDIVAKVLKIRNVTQRISRDFDEEFPKLRIFSHPNVLPVIGGCNSPPRLILIRQHLPSGSLYDVLHGDGGVVVDSGRALRFAVDVARGMAFLHGLERAGPEYRLNSRHVMVDEDLTARVSMAEATFSFQERGRVYYPAWMAPEALQKRVSDRNREASDMWSYAVLLWELATREVPFADLGAMEVGMRVALEGLRLTVKPGTSQQVAKLIHICMNEDPGKRPTFDMILPILDRMVR